MSSSAEVQVTGQPFEFGDLAPMAQIAGAADIESVIAEARARGHREGLESGRAEALRAVQPAADALAAAIGQLAAERDEFLAEAERAAVELALALASKIVCAAIDVHPELVLHVVESAVRHTTLRDQLTLQVSPEDFELVRDAADGLAGKIGGIRRLDVVAERRIARGGCILRTEEGEIDAQLEEQLERAREVVAEALEASLDDA